MNKLFIIILHISVLPLYSQVNKNDIQILLNEIIESEREKTIYTDKGSDWISNQMREEIKTGKLVAWSKKDSIVLTAKEQKYLLKQIKNQKTFIWPDSLFENSKRIEFDSLQPFLKSANWLYYTTINKLKLQGDTVLYKQLESPCVFSFTKPIYFRNNTLCIFNMIQMFSHSSGYSDSFLYKKINNEWVRSIVFTSGAW
jgi:hypothetical protein